MLDLERQGTLNINLVSPTRSFSPSALGSSSRLDPGLSLPLVYNTNGYERADVLEQLAGIIDIYLRTSKYTPVEPAARLSGAADYFEWAGPALRNVRPAARPGAR